MLKYELVNKKVEELEEMMMTQSTEELECPLVHNFSEGVYVREVTMPTGSIILGHEHTTTHFNMISKGSCILYDFDTEELTEIQAPCTFESKAGVRKLLYIVEECVWSTIHVTEETDVPTLESILVKESSVFKQIKGK